MEVSLFPTSYSNIQPISDFAHWASKQNKMFEEKNKQNKTITNAAITKHIKYPMEVTLCFQEFFA